MADTHDPRINYAPKDFDPIKDLPKGFYDLLLPLHRDLTSRQQALVAKRAERLTNAHRGKLPEHLPPSPATASEWHIDLPEWCADQRNQMTGPADDAELTVKMLNSGSPGVMLDVVAGIIEAWRDGYTEVIAAHAGMSRDEVRRTWEEMLTVIRDPAGYFVWRVPVWSGRVPARDA